MRVFVWCKMMGPGCATHSAESFVVIKWHNRFGELEVYFGLQPRTARAKDEYSLRDLLRMEGIREPESEQPLQVADESRLEPFLEKLAKDVRLYGRPVLSADRMYFRRLEAFRHARAQSDMQNLGLRRLRSEVEEAWRRREFDRVVELYSSIEQGPKRSRETEVIVREASLEASESPLLD
jgi:hypothetical protein